MVKSNIVLKGNREGLSVIINMNAFNDFEEMTESLLKKLSKGKKFYKGSTVKIVTDLRYIDNKNIRKLKDILFEEFLIKDCIFEDAEEDKDEIFNGVVEGRTKFLKKTIRSGQIINYQGNLVVVGDIHPGAEIYAAGNIIVLGTLKGMVHAGFTGNDKAFIAALRLQPQILQIANIVTRAPEDDEKPSYPEIAKVKNNNIIVEPYLPNKYL
ncbi:septum site-determining protein MinC [Hathewaya limosa]|uniref:Probable septum site-determining protein MinC n=1 Tax=Hathewaya limosa TaxID=1536 RepID=A0ABU0JTQ0_HATLI|nr:septum site-determining protein MinC [Hathewaya limosa]AWZ48836.1 septum site-determining protein MinC [Clostridiaceae bacterium 14S0207]MDQ0479513.1 septum site-determining protein MinC [Hathewaya limosa]